jgi:osmotically-inducible protein OsmY
MEHPAHAPSTDRRFLRRLLGAMVFLVLAAGCNGNDTEALSRIGHKITVYARRNTEEVSSKLDLRWKVGAKEPSLQEKIEMRLRWEKCLTECVLEVQVKDKEAELKGCVKSEEQRERAVELTQAVAGVEKVFDKIQVKAE